MSLSLAHLYIVSQMHLCTPWYVGMIRSDPVAFSQPVNQRPAGMDRYDTQWQLSRGNGGTAVNWRECKSMGMDSVRTSCDAAESFT